MKPLILGAAAAAVLHITPVVVLVKKTDTVTRLLPGADSYFARELHLSNADAHRLHSAVDWSPENGVLTFYSGKRAGTAVGVLVFVRVDSPHGPVEVAVGFAPDRSVRGVIVTKATVETKPWVLEALRVGLTDHYVGLRAGDAPAGAAALRDRVGSLPEYMAEQVDKAVRRALVAYGEFYRA